MNKELLCAAFCDELELRKVPAGIAVKTGFSTVDGDAIGFYIVRSPRDSALLRIEDSGQLVPLLEAYGLDMRSGQGGNRAQIFDQILSEYHAQFDKESRELHTDYMPEDMLPAAALRFVAMMLRLQDLAFLHPRIVESTFREDATKAIQERFKEVKDVTVSFEAPVSESLSNYQADAVIRVLQRPPVAVFYGNSDFRVNEGLILKMESLIDQITCVVALLLETPKPNTVSDRILTRATNRVDDVLVFRGDQKQAMERLYEIATGSHGRTH
jgi:hypothetical protein